MDKNQLESKNDSVLQKDIEEISNNSDYNFEQLNNKTVFITGAAGLIGSQIVKALACINRLRNLNIKIVAFVRNEEKAKKVFEDILDREYFEICSGDILDVIKYDKKVDYIIHGASPTESRFFVSNPVETIDIAVNGTKNILEYAKKNKIESMVYLSSLEVYGKNSAKELVSENDYGYIDILNVRSSYSEGKRIVECMCKSYFEEYGVPVKIARLSQTFGTGVEYNDKRVFAEFCRAAMEKKDIILHTEGKTVRTYCYTKDAIYAILKLLLNGMSGEAYNVSNMNTAMSIKEMAELVCEIFPDDNITVKVEIPDDVGKFGYNPEMIIKLDTLKIEKLGWKATTDLKEMFINMRNSIEQRNKIERDK